MNNLFKTVTSCSTGDSRELDNPHRENDKVPQAGHAHQSDFIFVKNLHIPMHIGVSDDEQADAQTVIVNINLEVEGVSNWQDDDINNVINYADVKSAAERIAQSKAFRLLETFAAYIADYCLNLPGCLSVRVQAEKPDIIKEVDSVGIEIFRTKT